MGVLVTVVMIGSLGAEAMEAEETLLLGAATVPMSLTVVLGHIGRAIAVHHYFLQMGGEGRGERVGESEQLTSSPL